MKFKSSFQKMAWGIIVCCAVLIAGMVVGGDFTQPRVEYFNGHSDFIAPQTGQFLFRFNRLMDRKSVEAGFKISPTVEGKFSWSGRTFAYTATNPLPYGQQYTVVFSAATDTLGKVMSENVFQASTKPYQAAYLNEQGRVMKIDVAARSINPISPENLFVRQFEISPDGKWLALLAIVGNRSDLQNQANFKITVVNLSSNDSLSVTTGTGEIIDNLQWLPDSTGIAYSYIEPNGKAEGLRMYDLINHKTVPLAENKARAYRFYFTPDGSRLAYIDLNGAIILGDVPSGNGALMATTFLDMAGFDEQGQRFAYISALSTNILDLANVPILMDGDGNEKKLPVPDMSTSFDLHFFPAQPKLIFTLETVLGTLRKNAIYHYDYQEEKLTPVVERDECDASHPVLSSDGMMLVYQCQTGKGNGRLLTGWNDYQGKIVTADLYVRDMLTTTDKNLGVRGADMQFIP